MPESLADLAYRHATAPGGATIPRVSLHVAQQTCWSVPTLYQPMLGFLLRGTKRVVIGDRTLQYEAGHFFIASVEVPASSVTIGSLPGAPYVAARLAIDPDVLSDLVVDTPRAEREDTRAFAVSAMTPALDDAWSRMLRLLDAPDEIDMLAPLTEREILFRILQGPQGALLRQATRADGRLAQIRAAIAHLRGSFDRVVRIEELLDIAGMSAATFHRHFRAATAMSPLQYQKALRLQEARRRLIADADVSGAAYAVGYESASQFNREYSRMFGNPPARDAARLRAGAGS